MNLKNIIPVLFLFILTGKMYPQAEFSIHVIDNKTHASVSIASADVDLDGDYDIILAAAEDNEIIWLRNDRGSPIKWKKISVGINFYGAKSVSVGDIDNDGDIDIVGCASDAAQIAVWYNSGGNPITWTKKAVRYNYLWAHEVSLSDIDNDGDLDILGASSNLNQINLFKNMGGNPIAWDETIIAEVFTQAKSVCAGDIDCDGDEDIVAASLLDNQIAWWQNKGNNLWSKSVISFPFNGAHKVQLIDLNDDGLLDVLSAGWYAGQIAWWKNNGGNPITWTKQIITSNFKRTCAAAAGDIDGDGLIDVAGTAQEGNQVAWWKNGGGDQINWTKFSVDDDFNRVWPVSLCDLDNDGDLDIIAGSGQEGTNEIKWYENDLIVTSSSPENLELPYANKLMQNYPNPFNPTTKIKYQISSECNVKVTIFNSTGEMIKELINKHHMPGSYEVYWQAAKFPSGVYFCQLETEKNNKLYRYYNKMILVK